MADIHSVAAELKKKHESIRTDLATPRKFPAISTGSLMVDTLTGIGGFPEGRVIELSGREGTGKCLALDTPIWTKKGLERLSEVTALVLPGMAPEEASRLSVMVRGECNRLLTSTYVYNAGEHDQVRVRTFDGHYLSGKADHRIRVVDPRGLVVWACLDDVEQRAPVVLQHSAQAAFGTGMSSSDKIIEASLWGLLAGSCRRKDGTALKIIDPEFQEEALFALRVRWDEDDVTVMDFTTATGELQLSDQVEDYIQELGLRDGIPYEIRTSSREVQTAYLRALFRSRVFWNEGKVEMVLYGENLTREVQLLSENWGLLWSWFETPDPRGDLEYKMYFQSLTAAQALGRISGNDRWQDESDLSDSVRMIPNQEENVRSVLSWLNLIRVPGQVRFSDTWKGGVPEDVVALLHNKVTANKVALLALPQSKGTDTIPSVIEIEKSWSLLLHPSVRTSPVTKIQWAEPMQMVDLTVPNAEHYQSAGFISHNSSLALTTALQCVYRPTQNFVLYLDYEHAGSESLMRGIGLPIDDDTRFLWVQPDNMEEGLEILEALHGTGDLGIVILDSYAAMTPKDQLTATRGGTKVQIGLQSAKITRWLESITKQISHSGTMIIFTNQYRAKINMSGREGIYTQENMQRWQVPEWFTPIDEDTAGGRAMKYYSTMRVRIDEVKPVMADRQNDFGDVEKMPIGKYLNFIINKNKVAEPYKRGKAVLEFGRGFDNVGVLLSLAKKKGIVEIGRTGHYKILDAQGNELAKGRGTEHMEQTIRGSNEMLGKIMSALGMDSSAKLEHLFPSLDAATVQVTREEQLVNLTPQGKSDQFTEELSVETEGE